MILIALPLLVQAAATPAEPVTPSAIVEAAPADAWREVAAERLLLVDLAGGSQVAIELADQFAPVHVANIRRLARSGWYDGGAVYRVQDNYVVQWGDGTEKKPLPPGITTDPPAEYDAPIVAKGFRPLGFPDGYARETGHLDGWPVARGEGRQWLAHCYGMVGVGRNPAPDTGTGAELYAVSGHAPRQLDRNIALVGRVLGGIEAMTGRPRGTGALGFYQDPAQWVKIARVRLAADLPPGDRPRWQVMRSDTASFSAWIRSRANRKDAFYIRPANGLDICNALPPTRPAP